MRTILPYVRDDLREKMVFIGGPRQCGKTTLAKQLLAELPEPRTGTYLNYDDAAHRQRLLARQWGQANQLVVLDELHKMPQWKGWLKGVYDTRPENLRLLVTGSARLDVYRHGGDSMLGRYHAWRLHPFCLGEYPDGLQPSEVLSRLMRLGGFPEPFIKNNLRFSQRWRRQRFTRILYEDVQSVEVVLRLNKLLLFVEALQSRVGSPIVLANIAHDLQVSPHTLAAWLSVLERMYLIFVVTPYTRKNSTLLQKAPKVYFYDNMDVLGDVGARFENLVATHLLKRLHFQEDYHGTPCSLHYVRDKNAHEVDFAVVQQRQLTELIEVKVADAHIAPALRYFKQRLAPQKARQIVLRLPDAYTQDDIHVQPVSDAFTPANFTT